MRPSSKNGTPARVGGHDESERFQQHAGNQVSAWEAGKRGAFAHILLEPHCARPYRENADPSEEQERRASPGRSILSAHVLAFMLRSNCFTLLYIFSMGFKSGLYSGRKIYSQPFSVINFWAVFDLWTFKLSIITISPALSVGRRNCSI